MPEDQPSGSGGANVVSQATEETDSLTSFATEESDDDEAALFLSSL